MNRTTKKTIRALVAHFGLRIKYVSTLTDKICGFLDPAKNSRTIIINGKKSKSENAFTIIHELAHYLLHYRRTHRSPAPWYWRRRWKSPWMNQFIAKHKRCCGLILNQECEADIWAFIVLWQIGALDDVFAVVKRHPHKKNSFYLAMVGTILTRIRTSLRQLFAASIF